MLGEIIENVVIVVLTIICMIAGAWIFLLFLQLLLKIKTGRREEEGLMDLWQTVITPTEDVKNKDNTSQ
jgi:ammonia channel protein AmtB